LWLAYKSVIADNHISRQSDKPCLKLHSITNTSGAQNGCERNSFDQTESEFTVISHNLFTGGSDSGIAQSLVALENQIPTSDERVSSIVVEGNTFVVSTGRRDCLAIRAQRITTRNNVFNLDNGPISGDLIGININKKGSAPAPSGTRVYNNTLYRGTESTGQIIAVKIGVDVTDTVMRNTLLSTQQSGSVLFDDSSAIDQFVESNNQRIDAAGFVNPGAGDFHLLISSPVIDVGFDVGVPFDFDGLPRFGNAYDIGAFENQGF